MMLGADIIILIALHAALAAAWIITFNWRKS